MKELFAAVEQGDYDKLQQLLEQKSDDNSLNINAKDKDGNTLLHLAATKGQIKILELLLQAGVDLDLQDAQGRTPLAVAKEQQQEAAVQYLATYAKREIIEPIDIAERRHPADVRWSSIQFARPPEQQDTESSSLLAQNLPPDVAQLLVQCQLNERELEKAMVKLGELKRLLKKSPYGHVLYSLAIQRFLQKVAMWPLLTKHAIQQPENKKESKGKSESEELKHQSSKDSLFARHLWPKNKSVLVSDPKVLKKVYGINGFFDGAGFVINRGWTGLIVVLLGLDIYNYYAYPFDREITNTKLSDIFLGTASNEKSLSTLLLDPKIWPGILALPLLWGLGKAIFATHQKDWDDKTIEKITAQFNHYRPSVWKDLAQWLPALISFRMLPEPTIKRLLDQIERALLWDGHLPSKERLKLFQAVRQLARTASQLTRLQVLATLAALADGVSPYDFPKLVEAGIDKEMLQTLLYLKTEAFADLRNFAERKIYSEENEPITVSRFHAAYAHYQLWRLGQPQSYALQPLFWGITLMQFYLQGYLLWRVIQGVINLVTFYIKKQECLNAGKLWLYMDQVADYVCSVCGDWPVFYGDIKTNKSCWEGLLRVPRTVQEIIDATERLNFDTIFTADFSQQNFTGTDLNLILPLLKKKAPGLQGLFLNNTMPINEPPLSGAKAIAEFINNSMLENLELDELGITDNDTAIIAQVLPGSFVGSLSLNGNMINEAGARALAKGLPGSNVQDLELGGNNIGDAGTAALAKGLPSSKVQTLNLIENNISEVGAAALAKGLPGSAVQNLYLNGNNISEVGAAALAKGLPGSAIQNLDLEQNNIGDMGATALGEVLPSSAVQGLYLKENNISEVGAAALAKGLPDSAVQALILWDNNIGDVGAAALAKELPSSEVLKLDLEGNNISDVGAVALAKGLPGSKVLELNLVGNNIGDAEVAALATGLPGSAVQELDLEANNISDMGATALGEVLPGSKVQVLWLGINNISDAGVAVLATGLPGSAVQNLDLAWNAIGDFGITSLAQSLRNSSVQSLDLSGNGIGYIGARALAHGLQGSKVQSLYLGGSNISDAGAAALAKGLRGSKLQVLWLGVNNIGEVGAAALAKGLPGSAVQYLQLWGNNIGDAGAIAIANTLITHGKHDLFFGKLDPDLKKALIKADPNTNLQGLGLEINNITNRGAEALCRVLPQTDIEIQSLDLNRNPITNVDINTCYTSGADLNSPYWFFRTIYGAYRMFIHYIDNAHHQVKDYFLSAELSEFDKNTSKSNDINSNNESRHKNNILNNDNNIETKINYSAISIAYNSTTIMKPISLPINHTNFLSTSVSNNSTVHEEVPKSAINSGLSLGEKWIAGQFLVGLVKKYSLFTLPWNREHALTAREQATLKHYQKQLQQHFKHQRESRAAAFESMADRFAYIADHIPKVQQAITKAFKHNKITNAQIQEITTTFNRLQECSQAIVKENQRLRKLEIKEYRQLRRAAKAGREQPAFKYSYDVVKQTLKHELVKEKETISIIPAWTPESRAQGCETFASLPTGSLLPCRDDKKIEPVSFAFGLLQQFWSRGDKGNAQPIAIEQVQQKHIPKLPT